MFTVPIVDNQPVAMRFDCQTVNSQRSVYIFPTNRCFQTFKNIRLPFFGVASKRLLPGMDFHQYGFLIYPCWLLPLCDAVVHGQSVLSFQFTANFAEFVKIAEWLMPGALFRVNHIIGHVHMDVARIFMHPTMALMFGIPQDGGKAFFHSLENFRG